MIESIMISSLAILSFVVDRGTLYFDLACIEIALEVSRIIVRVPEAPLNIRKQLK